MCFYIFKTSKSKTKLLPTIYINLNPIRKPRRQLRRIVVRKQKFIALVYTDKRGRKEVNSEKVRDILGKERAGVECGKVKNNWKRKKYKWEWWKETIEMVKECIWECIWIATIKELVQWNRCEVWGKGNLKQTMTRQHSYLTA